MNCTYKEQETAECEKRGCEGCYYEVVKMREEKKAIEYLKNRLEILHNNTQWATENSIKVVLNLIEKQSKEIEELNKSDASKEKSSMNYYNLYKELVDKIKAKIEEVNAEELNLAFIISGVEYKEAITRALQSLLEKE